MPFGPQPVKDNALIIGSKEIFSKENATITLNASWANLPADIADIKYDTTYPSTQDPTTHLYTYQSPNKPTTTPTVKLQFLEKGIWTDISSNIFALFTASSTEQTIFTKTIPDAAIDDDAQKGAYVYGTGSSNGFMRLVLQDDFGFKKYFSDLALFLIDKNNDALHYRAVTALPIEPYTPLLQSLTIIYTAHQSVDLDDVSESKFNNREIQFFHLYPFGETEQHKYLDTDNPVHLLPQFTHTEPITEGAHKGQKETFYHNGEMYIGLENLLPQQAVNILFEVLEGTTDPQIAKPADQVQWSVLSNNQWIPFGTNEVNDSTLALLQSGIISFAIPREATTNNTVLPANYIWIRAAISEIKNADGTLQDLNAAEAVCKLLSIDAQATVATFENNNNAADFLNNALPAGKVSKLREPQAAIKKITQPYPSFGGRPEETSSSFYIRVSERLRHKARAINIWDYEHIILEAFPEIYKVKCLNHTGLVTDPADGKEYTNELMPGHVLIITIPVLINRNDTNLLKPYTNQDTLTKIENYLRSRVSCFATVKARQPLFEEINMVFRLKLRLPYIDFVFYAAQLQDAITRYLTPWAYSDTEDIQFGGNIYKSSLINFIEEQYYVDFIEDVQMFQTIDEKTPGTTDLEVITASTVRSILVSAPAKKHLITEINDTAQATAIQCFEPNSNRLNSTAARPGKGNAILVKRRLG